MQNIAREDVISHYSSTEINRVMLGQGGRRIPQIFSPVTGTDFRLIKSEQLSQQKSVEASHWSLQAWKTEPARLRTLPLSILSPTRVSYCFWNLEDWKPHEIIQKSNEVAPVEHSNLKLSNHCESTVACPGTRHANK